MSGGPPSEADGLKFAQPEEGYGVVEQTPSTTSSSRRGIRDLPDLTDRLIQAGIYAEYSVYRQRYHQWRRGSAQGCRGELTVSNLQSQTDPGQFEYWYPTASIFKWRYTMAYWMSISYLLGALLFTFNAAVAFFNPRGYGVITTVMPNFVGSMCFTVGTYIGYLKVINIATHEEETVTYLVPDCTGMVQRAEVSSVIGAAAYFIGAICFQIACIAVVCPPMPIAIRLFVVELDNVFGSICFTIGGVCELIHNGVFFGVTSWRDPVWWASICNFVGGVNFLLGALPGVTALMESGWRSPSFVYFNFFIGSTMFIISSCLMLVMWQANDFGLTLLSQLNFAIRSGGIVGVSSANRDRVGVRMLLPEEAPVVETMKPKYSLRGAVFILIYCWLAFVSLANTFFREQEFVHAKNGKWLEIILEVAMQVFLVVITMLVLVIHSVVTEVPEEQPYFCALVSARCVLVAGAVVQSIWFVRFWLSDPSNA